MLRPHDACRRRWSADKPRRLTILLANSPRPSYPLHSRSIWQTMSDRHASSRSREKARKYWRRYHRPSPPKPRFPQDGNRARSPTPELSAPLRKYIDRLARWHEHAELDAGESSDPEWDGAEEAANEWTKHVSGLPPEGLGISYAARDVHGGTPRLEHSTVPNRRESYLSTPPESPLLPPAFREFYTELSCWYDIHQTLSYASPPGRPPPISDAFDLEGALADAAAINAHLQRATSSHRSSTSRSYSAIPCRQTYRDHRPASFPFGHCHRPADRNSRRLSSVGPRPAWGDGRGDLQKMFPDAPLGSSPRQRRPLPNFGTNPRSETRTSSQRLSSSRSPSPASARRSPSHGRRSSHGTPGRGSTSAGGSSARTETAPTFHSRTLSRLEGASSGVESTETSSPWRGPERTNSPFDMEMLKQRMEEAALASTSPRVHQKVSVFPRSVVVPCSRKAHIQHAATGMVIADKIHATIEEVSVA